VDVDRRERHRLAIALLTTFHGQGWDGPDVANTLLAGRSQDEALLGMLWLANEILGRYATETASNADMILQSIAAVEADGDDN
jgi:hypothetical protein